MPKIKVQGSYGVEVAMRRFRRNCEKNGLISTLRAQEFHEKPAWKRKRMKSQAVKRWKKKQAFMDR